MTASNRLPLAIDDVTTEWLRSTLRPAEFADELIDSKVVNTIRGTADKLIVELTAAEDSDLPKTVCVKGGFNDENRAVMADGYHTEARFFRDIAASLGARVPHCFYAASEPESGQGIVILEDLAAAGCYFGDPVQSLTIDQVMLGLVVLAELHAATWNERGLAPYAWLQPKSESIDLFYSACLAEEHWAPNLMSIPEELIPGELRNRQKIAVAIAALKTSNAAQVRCLVHGDSHVGNTFVRPDGSFGYVDWQTCHRGYWANDVAYFMVGALEVDDRRAAEWELLECYVSEMTRRGVPREQLGDVREQYRRQHLHGLFWAFMPPGYQPVERCHAMGAKYAQAISDHDTLRALGV